MSHRNLVGLLLGIALIGWISDNLYAESAGHPVVLVAHVAQPETTASRDGAGGAVERPALNLTEMFFPGLAATTTNPPASSTRSHFGRSGCNATCRAWASECNVQGGGSACSAATLECVVCCIEVGQPSWPAGVPPF